MKKKHPILEFDASTEAVIHPSHVYGPVGAPEHCVVCFFPEVMDHLRENEGARVIAKQQGEIGKHNLYELAMEGKRLAVFHPGIGAPLGAVLLEEIIVRGCRKFIACGGAGVLDGEVASGHILVPRSAVRDEGTSYHYLPPSREVSASPDAVRVIEEVLREHGRDYTVTKTWTTDAPYRETPAKVRLRRAEGCLAVDMEAAAFFAVAQFRGVPFGQILYAGDDVSGEEWDRRIWGERHSVRMDLFRLAAEACLRL